jgi:hypothetical protein
MFTWQAFTSTILAKLSYAIPATTLSQEECHQITKKLVSTTLTKAGINRHIPRDLVFGHESRQGLGFPDLYTWQGAEAIARIVRFGSDQNNITGQLLHVSYELLIIETGFSQPFQEDYQRWGELSTNCYMKHVWQFLSHYNIRLTMHREILRTPRQNDVLIMETMKDLIDVQDLKLFNQCRLYLQVLWISDITTAEGKSINWYAQHAQQTIHGPKACRGQSKDNRVLRHGSHGTEVWNC